MNADVVMLFEVPKSASFFSDEKVDTTVLIPFPGLSLIGTSRVTRARYHMTSNIYNNAIPTEHFSDFRIKAKFIFIKSEYIEIVWWGFKRRLVVTCYGVT